jgi:SAM-dependent methyltransferase
MTALAATCRLSGEPLAGAELLFEIADCPLPGIYPASVAGSLPLRSPLRVVQSRQSGFVQLAHVFDSALYQQYSFAGGGSQAYRRHLESFADEIARRFPKTAAILEVGCGDGWLLRRLRELGFTDVLGIDPSRAARGQTESYLVSGYFPQDIPASHRHRRFDLVISRHVLEHIENPRPFVVALAAALATDGQLWLEVPDLDSTLVRDLWSNFYQLHCNYFSSVTLDQMAATAGLRCVAGTVVEVFGGSLLRKYVHGIAPALPAPARLRDVGGRVEAFRAHLSQLARQIPAGTVGYGAAERTAVTLGFAPELAAALTCLHDGNPLLAGRYLAGTTLPIHGKEALFQQPPPVILLFAISNVTEILVEWQQRLPADVIIGIVGGEFEFQTLGTFKSLI